MNKEQAHDKGQTDASNGKHEPPHSHAKEFFSYGNELNRVHENNAAYQQGHNHTTEQKK
jgi:hypothetical protein